MRLPCSRWLDKCTPTPSLSLSCKHSSASIAQLATCSENVSHGRRCACVGFTDCSSRIVDEPTTAGTP